METILRKLIEHYAECTKYWNMLVENDADLLTEKKAFARMNAVDECIQIVKGSMEEQAKSEHDKQTNKQSDFVDSISRQAAIDTIAEKVFHNLTDEFYGVMQVLNELPSTDRNGHWLEANGKPAEGLHDVYCSECGEMSEYRSSFCPDCGADMRGV